MVPSSEFLEQWTQNDGDLKELSLHFHVSELMLARVALTHNKIDFEKYKKFEDSVRNYFEQQKAKKKDSESNSGPSPLVLLPIRNSRKLTDTGVKSAISGQMLLRDAGRLLNTSPQQIMNLSKKG